MTATEERLVLTKRDLAAALKVSTRTVERMRQRGTLPQPLSGIGRLRWSRDVIVAWLNERRAAAPSK